MNLEDVTEENTYYSFYGVNQNCFKLGQVVFEALEDENDGYRSYLESIYLISSDKIFQRRPIANVRIEITEYFTYLIDKDDSTILSIGTDNMDDYYPCFVFVYTPDTMQTEYVEELDPLVLHAEKFI
jgi:hypothetical protein